MRSHGIGNFPDPNSKGQFLDDRGLINGQDVDTHSSRYEAATKACTHLLPNGGRLTPAQVRQALAKALKLVKCVRAHGYPDMPDPRTTGDGIQLQVPKGVDPHSAKFQAAMKACRAFGGT